MFSLVLSCLVLYYIIFVIVFVIVFVYCLCLCLVLSCDYCLCLIYDQVFEKFGAESLDCLRSMIEEDTDDLIEELTACISLPRGQGYRVLG